MHLGKRRHFHGIIGDERGLDVCTFAELAENFVNHLALSVGFVHLFQIQLLANLAYFFLALAFEVAARFFFYGFEY